MQVPPTISDEALDMLLQLCCYHVGGMDQDEFSGFVGNILRIIEREVKRAKQEQRQRLFESEN